MWDILVSIAKSIGFFPLLSDKDLDDLREETRQSYCAGNSAAEAALETIDKEKRRRYEKAHPGEEPGLPAKKNWYFEDDD